MECVTVHDGLSYVLSKVILEIWIHGDTVSTIPSDSGLAQWMIVSRTKEMIIPSDSIFLLSLVSFKKTYEMSAQ